MDSQEFFSELERRIAKYDLLCHPFYQAWSRGELTRDELRDYAGQYYHQVATFPECLREFSLRLTELGLRSAVLCNWENEAGAGSPDGRSHAELWLDFAEGMGGRRQGGERLPEVQALLDHFLRVAREGTEAEALAAFYAYESQVPRVSQEKARGLRAWYGAGDKACRYFDLHVTADLYHTRAWRGLLGKEIEQDPAAAGSALQAAEDAARSLYAALDGIERQRQARRAA